MDRQELLNSIMKYFADLNLDQIAFPRMMIREILRDTPSETYKEIGS